MKPRLGTPVFHFYNYSKVTICVPAADLYQPAPKKEGTYIINVGPKLLAAVRDKPGYAWSVVTQPFLSCPQCQYTGWSKTFQAQGFISNQKKLKRRPDLPLFSFPASCLSEG